MDYEGIRPSFELEYFSKMNKKQAMQYFEWFMETKEERFRILQEYIFRDTDKVILDKTPESLIGLWEWFQTKISWEEKTREEIELELKGRPEWMTQIILADTKKIADLTLKLAYDIGMYFGEVFVENNSSLYWGIKTKPKALNGVNQPNVLGFLGDVNMYAYGIVQVAIRKEHKETKVTRLFDIYNTWLDMNVKN
ncbi:MAG: hypothetical protein IJD58_02175 [Lachnospiraceae bacterium]|nr:hypothetical protein [Lachnospiraceae bacterium]